MVELFDNMTFILDGEPRSFDPKAAKLLDVPACSMLERLGPPLAGLEPWTESNIETTIREFAAAEGVKLGAVAQPLRTALTGRAASPGIFEVLAALGPRGIAAPGCRRRGHYLMGPVIRRMPRWKVT